MGSAQVENAADEGHKEGHGPYPSCTYMKIKDALDIAHGTLNGCVEEDGNHIGKKGDDGDPV